MRAKPVTGKHSPTTSPRSPVPPNGATTQISTRQAYQAVTGALESKQNAQLRLL